MMTGLGPRPEGERVERDDLRTCRGRRLDHPSPPALERPTGPAPVGGMDLEPPRIAP
jgi:hypothetical protein